MLINWLDYRLYIFNNLIHVLTIKQASENVSGYRKFKYSRIILNQVNKEASKCTVYVIQR